MRTVKKILVKDKDLSITYNGNGERSLGTLNIKDMTNLSHPLRNCFNRAEQLS